MMIYSLRQRKARFVRAVSLVIIAATSMAGCASDSTSRRIVYMQRIGNDAEVGVLLKIEERDEPNAVGPTLIASVQGIDDQGRRPYVEAQFGCERWDVPLLFDGIAVFRSSAGGSSTSYSYEAFDLTPSDPRLIEIEMPTTALSHLLGPGQQLDPRRVHLGLSEDGQLLFCFNIWNAGDGHNFPSGGTVTGTLVASRDSEHRPRAISVRDWTFRPLDGEADSQTKGSAATVDSLHRYTLATAARRAIQSGGDTGSLQAGAALRDYEEARAAYLAALAAEYRQRLAYTWWQSADGSEQFAKVRESIAARDELMARWSPLGDGGFSRREVESILGQPGRDEPSEQGGYVSVVVYWWDWGYGGSGLRVWYQGEARNGYDRAVRTELVPGE
jgi:hypothetical protein